MAEQETRQRLTYRQMLEMQGQTPGTSNGAKLPSPWTGLPGADPNGSRFGGVLPSRGAIENDYPPSPAEKKQLDTSAKICKDNEALLNETKKLGSATVSGSRPGGELDPKIPAQKKVIDELKEVFGIAKETEAKIIVAPYTQGNKEGTEIIARSAGNDKTLGRIVYAPPLNRTMFFTGADTQQNVEAICKSAFAVLDKNKELYDKIKTGDQEALGKLTAALGKATGLKDGENFSAMYQPGTRKIEMPDGTTVKANVEMIVFRQPTGNMIKVERAFDADHKPIESGYRCNGGFIPIGTLKANIK